MNFTNSPYERMMKEVPHYKDRLVRGVLIGGGSPVFSATGSTSKSRADMLAFGPKRRPVFKGFRPQP